ncbi:hypothetical protein GTJ86_12990 [Escherichia coli]|nr:hypothetical protein [Escherichia coli]NKB03939.1 hypothetical protein [Escherichia coli]
MKINPDLIGVVVIAGLSVALVKSCSHASNLQSDNDVLRSDNSMLEQVIATQAFNFNRFNQVAEHANSLNSLIDTSTEKTVIEYREILRREKTCDLPVPADIAGGLTNSGSDPLVGVVWADAGTSAEEVPVKLNV